MKNPISKSSSLRTAVALVIAVVPTLILMGITLVSLFRNFGPPSSTLSWMAITFSWSAIALRILEREEARLDREIKRAEANLKKAWGTYETRRGEP